MYQTYAIELYAYVGHVLAACVNECVTYVSDMCLTSFKHVMVWFNPSLDALYTYNAHVLHTYSKYVTHALQVFVELHLTKFMKTVRHKCYTSWDTTMMDIKIATTTTLDGKPSNGISILCKSISMILVSICYVLGHGGRCGEGQSWGARYEILKWIKITCIFSVVSYWKTGERARGARKTVKSFKVILCTVLHGRHLKGTFNDLGRTCKKRFEGQVTLWKMNWSPNRVGWLVFKRIKQRNNRIWKAKNKTYIYMWT